jgi:glycosyltransferase involved in cell wall biosynthesis
MLYQKIISKISEKYFDVFSKPFIPLLDKTCGNNLSKFEAECTQWISNVEYKFSSLPPISFVYRLKNADKFLALSVSSIVPIANEIIFVDNGSSDNTRCIINDIASKLSDKCKIQVLQYNHQVHRQGVEYANDLANNPNGSLARYYNYCFDNSSNEYVFKIDAHKFLLPDAYEKIYEKMTQNLDFVFLRGYDFYGRFIDYEPLLYKNKPDVFYEDGECFEFLNYKSKCSLRDVYKGRIHSHSFVHVKSLTYPTSV